MNENNPTNPAYLLGRTQRETKRLQQQERLFEPFTRRLFDAAGFSKGMKVLDVGSGAGMSPSWQRRWLVQVERLWGLTRTRRC